MARATDHQTAADAGQEVRAQRSSPASEPGDAQAAPSDGPAATSTIQVDATAAPVNQAPHHSTRRGLLLVAGAIALSIGLYVFIPWLITALTTVSTDDAYVNGHVTLVAPRVAGQVQRVLVDDNYRVKKGDVLVELDQEPFQVEVAIKKAAVGIAESDLAAAEATVRGYIAQARANRYKLEHSMEDVRNQLALLKSNVAKLKVEQANLALAKADFARYQALVGKGAVSQQEFDQYKAALDVAKNRVASAEEVVQQTRASLGLTIDRENPLNVPADLEQNFSTVREALSELLESASQFGYTPSSWNVTPRQALETFYKQDPEGNLDRIFTQLIPNAPTIKQANAKVEEARRDLDMAELNLRYCNVVSEIDGVVTRRNVNPGNNVQVGQSLMAVRSLTEIWIDANFKETQLAYLRIGQPVRCRVDMYGRKQEFQGRITGFTMGTGQTLALLPPQNATGNFVKIVQRLAVRIELTDYDPDKVPLFVGLSVEPFVYYKQAPSGPHAGEILQPVADLPRGPTEPKP